MDRLSVGVPTETWDHLLTTTPDGNSTVVQNVVVRPGSGGEFRAIPGAWRLPTVGLDPMPVGLAADGRTTALVEARAPDALGTATTQFAILKGALDPHPRIIKLGGEFDFDAISPVGATLFVVEHLPAPPAGHYQVRAVDVATGTLRDGVITDKRNADEQMGGWAIAQLRRRDGLVLTLYRGEEHPFIHALDTVGAWAVCIDLPAAGHDATDAARDWGWSPPPMGSPWSPRMRRSASSSTSTQRTSWRAARPRSSRPQRGPSGWRSSASRTGAGRPSGRRDARRQHDLRGRRDRHRADRHGRSRGDRPTARR